MIKGSHHSQEAKDKLAAAHKGKKRSDEHRANMSQARKGVPIGPHTEETKRKISAALKGRVNGPPSEETRQKISSALRGKRTDGKPMRGSYVTSEGYRKLTGQWEHPRCRADGTIHEHEKVLYDAIGEGQHRCHWECGRMLTWDGGTKLGIVADHLDHNRLNNDPANLVPSCRGENWSRWERVKDD